jgi:hypothetical protein
LEADVFEFELFLEAASEVGVLINVLRLEQRTNALVQQHSDTNESLAQVAEAFL